MVIMIYNLGFVVTLLAGSIIGVLVAAAHHEHADVQQREYENEKARSEDLYIAARALLRHGPQAK
jgi:hypothetical protein